MSRFKFVLTNMHRVAPGLYYDKKNDSIHLVADELLLSNGWPATEGNLETVRKVAKEVFAEEFPGATVVEHGFES